MTVCIPSTTPWPAGRWTTASDDDLARRDIAEILAWTTLQTLTAGRLAICPIEVRPARASCRRGTYYVSPVSGPTGPFHPYIGVDGQWRNEVHAPGCDCGNATKVELPMPVGRIDAVVIDGVQLDPNAYRVDGGRWLVRTDGKGWPLTQDMYRAAGDDGTFYVRLFVGAAPDQLADYAAGVLAQEYLAGMGDGKRCRLPMNVRLATRQGVSYEAVTSIFEEGVSGIPEVDAFVARLNPYHRRSGASVVSVDTMHRPSQRTTLGPGSGIPVGPGAPGNLVPDTDLGAGYYRLEPSSGR